MTPARLLALLCLLTASIAATTAAAQERELEPAEREEARALFAAGAAAVDGGRWADAIRSFERAYELTGAPSALYNLGLAFRALGRHRESRDAFDRLLRDHDLEGSARADAQHLRDEEAARVAVLELVGLAEDARHAIRLDGRDVIDSGQRPVRVEADAGPHTLVTELTGFRPFVWEGTLSDGEHLRVSVLLSPDAGPIVAAGDDTAVHWVIALAVGAAVIAGGAVGGYYAWDAAQVRPLYDQRVEP